ncbi:MAG: FAD-dependent oxidoreductase [Thermodesulfobacteriota bacterium]|nr:FAD-dependent oxidoreductase [Thermodesulfobacteriota bacterium]
MKKIENPSDLATLRQNILNKRKQSQRVAKVCCSTGCRAGGSLKIVDALNREIASHGLDNKTEIKKTGCRGFCENGPVLAVDPDNIFYNRVEQEDVGEILSETLIHGRPVERLLYTDPETNKKVTREKDIPFFGKQVRRVLANCGQIDPTDIEDYIAVGGYEAIVKALFEMSPELVIDEVTKAKLRGRGGAGFPTGLKWKFAREAEIQPKYIICNADEGDPGAFMDRSVLEGDPHVVLEGMLIGAYAIGAEYGYIYVREEYPIAVEHLSIAIEQMRELGLLGGNILGTGFNLDIFLKKGSGAFVCGEETALIASIEGRRGMPRPRPPFPAKSGLDGKPTNINNVETWANIPLIIKNGVDWYTQIGTKESKGTKIFSLVGKVNNTGLVEVPIGVTIKEVVFDIGGGILKGRQFKAVQMGGPSGGCVPAQYLNLPIDYDTLQRIGAIMGSGGMVVMDENNCMVEIARFFLNFTQEESCGKCVPCRTGTTQLLTILTRITMGQGRIEDLNAIQELGDTITEASLCGLGQTCPKPALSTLKYFLKEYEDHILEHRCAGAMCDSMVISACQHACPAGIDVPNYVASIASGKYEQAVEIIRERNPFPAVCGRICVHPCEFKCRRGELDDSVAIRSLKRFASDWYFENIGLAKAPFPVSKKEKVAVIGAGPAGLTCAYFLAKNGYKTTVFEAQDVAGGMLRITVPEFRLPRDVIQREVDYIESCGVEILYNSPIDVRYTINDLMANEYCAVFIAAGAQVSKRIGIAGEEENLNGVYYGLQFLYDIKMGKEITLKGKVVVIGGGNVAIDVARTALRVGARDVQIFYRRTKEEMPAWEKDVDEAIEEGVVIHPLWTPKQILHKGDRVTGIEFVRSKTVFDEEGRSHIGIEEDETQIVDVETVIVSIGQAPDISFLSRDSQLERALWGSLEVDENSLATNIPGIFGGGDFITGPSTVIKAIASGRRAAIAIDKYLKKDKGRIEIADEKTSLRQDIGLALEEETTEERPRVPIEVERPEQRVKDFREVERGFSEKQAHIEAMRCLRCDLEKERESI